MGVGKVGGRLLLLGPLGRRSLTVLACAAAIVQLAGLAVPLATAEMLVVLPILFVVGAASGATTVLRPLIVVDLVGPSPFAATNARIQRTSTIARAAAPLVLGLAVSALGWSVAWLLSLAAFAIAAERYAAIGRNRERPTMRTLSRSRRTN
jgi:MFS family permease